MNRKVMTVIRTVLLVLALVNEFLGTLGVVDFGNATANSIYKIISTVATIGAAAWAWWKNNSITPEAQEADVYLDLLKSKKDLDEIDGEGEGQ
ncbi:MAG: phage holin [Clostridia bacterium]|nr:phage holin [Clostridia bacterium]